MIQSHKSHSDQVDVWVKQLTKDLSSDELVDVFELAVNTLWKGSRAMLSAVMVTAVWERVLFIGSENHSVLFCLKTEESGIKFDELRAANTQHNERYLIEAFRLVITEYISILGNITNGVVPPFLYEELSKIKPDRKMKSPMNPNGDET